MLLYDFSIGKSVESRDLWVLEIGSNPGKRKEGQAHVKFVGGIHGNDLGGSQLLLQLAQHLCENYGTDYFITEVWFCNFSA